MFFMESALSVYTYIVCIFECQQHCRMLIDLVWKLFWIWAVPIEHLACDIMSYFWDLNINLRFESENVKYMWTNPSKNSRQGSDPPHPGNAWILGKMVRQPLPYCQLKRKKGLKYTKKTLPKRNLHLYVIGTIVYRNGGGCFLKKKFRKPLENHWEPWNIVTMSKSTCPELHLNSWHSPQIFPRDKF